MAESTQQSYTTWLNGVINVIPDVPFTIILNLVNTNFSNLNFNGPFRQNLFYPSNSITLNPQPVFFPSSSAQSQAQTQSQIDSNLSLIAQSQTQQTQSNFSQITYIPNYSVQVKTNNVQGTNTFYYNEYFVDKDYRSQLLPMASTASELGILVDSLNTNTYDIYEQTNPTFAPSVQVPNPVYNSSTESSNSSTTIYDIIGSTQVYPQLYPQQIQNNRVTQTNPESYYILINGTKYYNTNTSPSNSLGTIIFSGVSIPTQSNLIVPIYSNTNLANQFVGNITINASNDITNRFVPFGNYQMY